MFILDDLLAEITIQDIVNANSAGVIQIVFNTLFNTKNMVNFYVMDFSSFLAYNYFKKREDLTIEDNISQLPDDLILRQK